MRVQLIRLAERKDVLAVLGTPGYMYSFGWTVESLAVQRHGRCVCVSVSSVGPRW